MIVKVAPLPIVILLALVTCSPGISWGQSSAQDSQTANEASYLNIVTAYVRRTRGWSDGTYTVQFQRREGNILAFWVLHKEDNPERPDGLWIRGGGGKSFEADVNVDTRTVERELHFQ